MLETLNEIWQQAGALERTYWIFAVPSSLFFLVIIVTTFIGGGDLEASPADLDTEVETGVAGQYFTLKNLVGFFLLFSWTGLACLHAGVGTGVTVLLSVLAGTLMLLAMAWLFRAISGMAESGTLRMQNAVGCTANVYMNIPGARGGIGKVHVTVQGSLRELDALTDDERTLTTGTVVRVEEVIDGHILRVSAYNTP